MTDLTAIPGLDWAAFDALAPDAYVTMAHEVEMRKAVDAAAKPLVKEIERLRKKLPWSDPESNPIGGLRDAYRDAPMQDTIVRQREYIEQQAQEIEQLKKAPDLMAALKNSIEIVQLRREVERLTILPYEKDLVAARLGFREPTLEDIHVLTERERGSSLRAEKAEREVERMKKAFSAPHSDIVHRDELRQAEKEATDYRAALEQIAHAGDNDNAMKSLTVGGWANLVTGLVKGARDALARIEEITDG